MEFQFFFGDHYQKNPEADELIAQHGGKSFEDEFFAAPYILNLLNDEESMKKMSENARNFIDSQPNASDIILNKILS